VNVSIFDKNQLAPNEHHANLKLLIWLRLIAIAGQFTAIFIAKNVLEISLQTGVPGESVVKQFKNQFLRGK